jgi:hypothetical protein
MFKKMSSKNNGIIFYYFLIFTNDRQQNGKKKKKKENSFIIFHVGIETKITHKNILSLSPSNFVMLFHMWCDLICAVLCLYVNVAFAYTLLKRRKNIYVLISTCFLLLPPLSVYLSHNHSHGRIFFPEKKQMK